MKPISRTLVWALSILICTATATLSRESIAAVESLDIAELGRVADVVRQGVDPRFTASRADESGREPGRTVPSSLILVSVEGAPAFVYQRGAYFDIPEGQPEFVMRCRGGGVIDFSVIVRQLMEAPDVLNPDADYALRITPYGQDLEYNLPVSVVETFPSHKLLVRVAGSARADEPFFTSLRGTTNFSYGLRKDGQQLTSDGEFTPMTGGVDFSTFRSDVGPLLEHCRAGNANPLDGIDLDEIETPGVIAQSATPTVDLDLAFLETSEARYFRRIYEGRQPSAHASLRMRMLTYFGFHLAYWEHCAQASDTSMHFYTTTPLSEVQTIGIVADDYAPFVVAASAYSQVSRAIYDSEVRNDFSFSVVTQRSDESMREGKNAWAKVFSNHGCSGDVVDRFRENLRGLLPWLEYSEGSHDVVVDFGGRQFDLRLRQPVNIDLTRQAGAAMAATGQDDMFTSNYPGLVLRSIALGNFELAERIEDDFIAFASNPIGLDPDNPVTRFLGFFMQLESTMKRQSNLITAYALGRMHILGACGDPTTSYQQDRVYWTEYTNGLGQHVSSSAETRRTSFAEVPSKFDSVIEAQNSITTSDFLAREMATIISQLSCNSPARLQLEENMIAFFNGRPPAHVGPVPKD